LVPFGVRDWTFADFGHGFAHSFTVADGQIEAGDCGGRIGLDKPRELGIVGQAPQDFVGRGHRFTRTESEGPVHQHPVLKHRDASTQTSIRGTMHQRMNQPINFNVFVAGLGYHQASWAVSPRAHEGALGLDHFIEAARIAERGMLDSLFFADSPATSTFRSRFMLASMFDPIDLLAALTPVTSEIGLYATASTTYSAPWDLARRFATLDTLSKGRAGWNIVTTGNAAAAHNFSMHEHPEHADRYLQAHEFVEVVLKVWDGWEDDAVIASVERGEWADPAKLHPPDHRGRHFNVSGILPFPRSPQGYPVLAQAGSSNDGINLAGRFADLVFTPQASIDESLAFKSRLAATANSHGRDPDDLRMLPGLSFVLGSTDAEATRAWQSLEDATSEEFRLRNLTSICGMGPDAADGVDVDGPFPFALFEQAKSTTFAAAITRVAREEGLTFRETSRRFSTLPGGLHHTGTPESLAALISEWWRSGACEGFTLQPLRLPLDLEIFVDEVMPILRREGIAQHEYRDGTARAKLGLRRPENRYAR
jgi:N-acetyl-S-(2-succino)cysteine monooxygenase